MNQKVDGSPTPLQQGAQRNVAQVECHQWKWQPKLGSLVVPELARIMYPLAVPELARIMYPLAMSNCSMRICNFPYGSVVSSA